MPATVSRKAKLKPNTNSPFNFKLTYMYINFTFCLPAKIFRRVLLSRCLRLHPMNAPGLYEGAAVHRMMKPVTDYLDYLVFREYKTC